MVKKEWQVQLDDGSHTIQLDQGYFSARRQVRLDGRLLPKTEVKSTQSLLGNNDYEFAIGAHQGKVITRSNLLSYTYDPAIDNKSVATGLPIAPLPPIPVWAWIFVIACGLIPFVALGGAIPILLGLGGVSICLALARDTARSVVARVAMCIGVTLLAWILYYWGGVRRGLAEKLSTRSAPPNTACSRPLRCARGG